MLSTFAPAFTLATAICSTDAPSLQVFLEAHCTDCHSGRAPKGDINIESLLMLEDNTAANSVEDLLRWDRVRARMQARDMPPRSDRRPSAADFDAALVHVEWIIDEIAAAHASPGSPAGRRLNRTEWRHAVADLTGVDMDVDDLLPADEIGHGFDTVGDTLSLSPPLLEKFIELAEFAAARAIADPDAPVYETTRIEGEGLSVKGAARRSGQGIRMHSRASAIGAVELPRAGRYRVVLHAGGQQAGPDPVRFALDAAGARVALIDVPEREISPHQVDVELPGGRVEIRASFVNDYYRPDAEDPRQRDRNAIVQAIEVQGPLDEPVLSSLQASLEPDLSEADTPTRKRRALRRLVQTMLPRAWRCRPTTAQIDSVVSLAVESADAPHAQARTAITAILAHPRFLLRLESDPESGQTSRHLNGHEIAARMALLLWSSVPDDQLLQAAWNGELNTPQGRQKHLRRMLDDPRSKRLAESFASQWLQVRRLDQLHPDPRRFPGIDASLLRSMQRETIDTFDHLMREDRPWTDLLMGSESIVDAQLGAHYGMNLPPDGTHLISRAHDTGILGHAAVLTATSNPTRTSPVKRGKWVLEALLDAPPPPAPPGIDPLPDDGHSGASLRDMMIEHRRNPNCATCHARMDELGFAMESFDAVGRPRPEADDRGLPPGDPPIEGLEGLRDWVLSRNALPRSLARHMLTYAVGRGFDVRDETAIDAVAAHLVQEGRLSSLLEAVVESPVFLNRGSTLDATP
ncbi:MAG: DUF1592 domain-containing protein [Phycisphaerales bacterium]|nr:DUF1592 domain-containing protein [Phycisphaerales bacterium]